MPKKRSTDFTESTRPGTVYKVFEQHKKTELNHDGKLPVYIVPDVSEKNNKFRM